MLSSTVTSVPPEFEEPGDCGTAGRLALYPSCVEWNWSPTRSNPLSIPLPPQTLALVQPTLSFHGSPFSSAIERPSDSTQLVQHPACLWSFFSVVVVSRFQLPCKCNWRQHVVGRVVWQFNSRSRKSRLKSRQKIKHLLSVLYHEHGRLKYLHHS